MYKLIFIWFCIWQPPAWADKFVVATQNFNYYPHYNFQSATNRGIIWAFLQEFSAISGHQFVYHKMPVLRLQRELEKGTIDLVYPDNPLFNNKSFAKGKIYSDTLVRTLGGTMVKASKLNQGISMIKRLSIPLGFTPQRGWQERIDLKKVTLVQVNTPLAELQLLAKGRVDAAEVDYFVSQYQLKNNPQFREFVFAPKLPNSVVEFKLSTIKQIPLIKEINDFIRTQPEVMKKLKIKYGISEPELILQQLKQGVPIN